MTEKIIRTENEAIEVLRKNKPASGYYMLQESVDMAIQALEEVQQYRAFSTVEEIDARFKSGTKTLEQSKKVMEDIMCELEAYQSIGTVEEMQKAVMEEDVLKFYYIESEDKYVVGQRVDNFYYGEVGKTGLVFYMSRYLPWGEHVVDDATAWKEYTYPSEPKEMDFNSWLQGFIKKECGGTIEECREAVEKQRAKKPINNDLCTCPTCGTHNEVIKKRRNTVVCDTVYCWHCGHAMKI